MWGAYKQDCAVYIPDYCLKHWMSIPVSCLVAQHRLWTVMECPHLVTCDGIHQYLIIWFWVKQMCGVCFFNVAKMSIATLLEPHFLEAKVSIDSHSQDTIRTDTTFHQLWLCNTSVCVCWFIDEWEHVTWCGRSAILSNPQNMTSYLRTCGLITHHLYKWCITVHVYMFKCSSFGQSKLNNSLDPFFCPHLWYSHYFGTSPVHAYLLPHLYNHLWHTVTAHKIYISSCNSSPSKIAEKFTL